MHCGGSEDAFPKSAHIQANGHDRLYDLIMEYGGRKLIAQKLDMTFQANTKIGIFSGMTFGSFSLDFAVRLLTVIRLEMMKADPPLDNPKIKMPTTAWLLGEGHDILATEVKQYGGHENIARRLNLEFDRKEAMADALASLKITQEQLGKRHE
jgi:hypothetical protein